MQRAKEYLLDGANWQARAVLMCFQVDSDIEASWSDEFKRYTAEVNVGRWENCREQGYVLILNNRNYDQLNIAFFEHRNSDSICAIKWLQSTVNSPTIDTANFGDVYKDKYDVSFSVKCGEFMKMSDWIKQQFESHWAKEREIKKPKP